MPTPFQLRDARCVVTGASRGLGRHIAIALAKEGAVLHLVARSRPDLERIQRDVEARGARASIHALDIGDHAALTKLRDTVGDIDVLVNNAGIDTIAYFHEIALTDVLAMLAVNLGSAMVLTHLLLPGMVARKHGHVVNIASLAGKTGPPLAETYAATKAGLIAFSQSLRASYSGTGVSASVVCPGYISGEGMFAERSKQMGGSAPKLIGTSPPEDVGRAVVRAIQHDEPELLVTPTPARLFTAIGQLQPRFPGWLIRTMKLRALYESQRAKA